MNYKNKTKAQLVETINSLQKQLQELDSVESDAQRVVATFLKNQETLYKFMDSSPDAFFLLDAKLDFITANKAAQEVVNRPLQNIIGSNLTEFVPDPKGYDRFVEVVKTGKPLLFPDFTPYQYQGQRQFSLRAFRVGNGLGIILTEITELSNLVKELQNSEVKFRGLANSIDEIFIAFDRDMKYIYWNHAAERLTGKPARDVVGKHFFDIFPADETTRKIENIFKKALQTNKPQYFTSDYHYFGKDCIHEISVFPTQNGASLLIRDITQRVKTERALQESENKFRLLTESSLTGIFIHEDGRFIYVNDRFAEMHGYKVEELLGMKFSDLMHPSVRNLVQTRVEKRLRGESTSWLVELPKIKKSGEVFWVQFVPQVIEFNGKPAIMGNIIDITERKKLEAEKLVAEQKARLTSHLAAVGELAAGIIHEINNPLTIVVGYADLLSVRSDVSQDIKKDLHIIRQSSQHAADIIRRLLTFARQSNPVRDRADINELIQNTIELRAYQLQMNNIQVDTDLDFDLPATVADGGQLQQVFMNIVANAESEMKASHGKGNLIIETRLTGDMICISFKDDGPGIPEDNLQRIFNPFFTTREPGKGAGLGLSVCYGIVSEHGGRIWAESEYGKGATFFVELPVTTKSPKPIMSPTGREGTLEHSIKIIVVDDDETVRTYISRALTNEGYLIDSASTAREALDKIRNNRYSLILLDIKMPDMDGKELYNKITEIATSIARRIVFITGDIMGSDTQKFFEDTQASYITKPFDSGQLKEIINLLVP